MLVWRCEENVTTASQRTFHEQSAFSVEKDLSELVRAKVSSWLLTRETNPKMTFNKRNVPLQNRLRFHGSPGCSHELPPRPHNEPAIFPPRPASVAGSSASSRYLTV